MARVDEFAQRIYHFVGDDNRFFHKTLVPKNSNLHRTWSELEITIKDWWREMAYSAIVALESYNDDSFEFDPDKVSEIEEFPTIPLPDDDGPDLPKVA